MAVIATVTVRPLARRRATAPPARSICDNSQPPKISPYGLASAGMAMARSAGSACGESGRLEACMENPIAAAAWWLPLAETARHRRLDPAIVLRLICLEDRCAGQAAHDEIDR